MTSRRSPALVAGWPDALARGFVAFLAMTAVGQVLAVAVWAVGSTGASIGAFARIGWMYFGMFHHVAVELDVRDLDVSTGGSGPGASSVTVGIALLSLTAVAAWLLFRAGRAVADRCGGSSAARVLHGAKVAPAYAAPAWALAALVVVETPLRLGSFATGELRVALTPWQALAFPFAIAALSGACGGLRSALDARAPEDRTMARVAAATAGGWRMLVVGLALSFGGLFLTGVVQPDGPAALLTPSTARYLRAVFDRPVPGLVALAHHLAFAPNEATWTLVPAMGGCDVIRGSVDADVLCYGRFPVEVETAPVPLPGGSALLVPIGGGTFDRAPTGYLLFLLVPAAATVIGGRRAAEVLRGPTDRPVVVGAAAGLVFAASVAAVAMLSTVTIGYGTAFGGGAAGRVIAGPDVATATAIAAVWGVVGGGLGAASVGRIGLRSGSSPRAG